MKQSVFNPEWMGGEGMTTDKAFIFLFTFTPLRVKEAKEILADRCDSLINYFKD